MRQFIRHMSILVEAFFANNLRVVMISLAIGSGLMIAVLIRYVRTRQKFTQWSPPNWNSGSTSQGGTEPTGSQDSSHRNLSGRRGLYDRWLMVRFTIAFVSLAYDYTPCPRPLLSPYHGCNSHVGSSNAPILYSKSQHYKTTSRTQKLSHRT